MKLNLSSDAKYRRGDYQHDLLQYRWCWPDRSCPCNRGPSAMPERPGFLRKLRRCLRGVSRGHRCSVAAFSIGITDEFKGIVRVCFSNLDEVIHLCFFRGQRLVFVKSEVNAFEVVVVSRSFGRSRSVNRFLCRSWGVNRSCRFRSFFLRTTAKAIGNASDEAFIRDVSIVI